MTLFKNLSVEENENLLKFPAFLCLLAANSENNLIDVEKKIDLNFAYTKTFSFDPLLAKFYKKADKLFPQTIKKLDKDLPNEMNKRDAAIKKELLDLDNVVLKMGQEYSSLMLKSMQSFKDHVSQAHHNVLVDFIFPIPIAGYTY